jgi:hypothetical protein
VRIVRALKAADGRKNATTSHAILPHSFTYPLSNFQHLILALAPPPFDNASLSSLLIFCRAFGHAGINLAFLSLPVT